MTIFKAFLQILNKNKGILIVYSLILIIFSLFSLKSNESTVNFEATRPDIYIINHDLTSDGTPSVLSASLIDYLAERSNLIELNSSEVDDAIFYRHVNFALEIPANFEADFLADQNPAIAFKSTGDYNASLAEMNLSRYLELAGAYKLLDLDVAALARKVESTLAAESSVTLLSHLDSSSLARAAYYYNFLNYPLLVGCIFMICLILLSFRGPKIANRLAIGAIPQAKINRILLGANLLFAFCLWFVYVALSFVIVGIGASGANADHAASAANAVSIPLHPLLSGQGMLLILSSFIFTFCVVTLAFLLANLIKSRNVLNGLVNVIGIGSSFMCGVFVPLVWLPDSVRLVAHLLPSYWYVKANDLIANLEEFTWSHLLPILGCFLTVIGFAAIFMLATHFVSARRQHLSTPASPAADQN